ncbi:hypothetical protein NP233_g11980 [Leucocoprinus birnbaumii]|uniref:DUF6532 domain-containing protein n=1 Tax=Leucocoprinus birnbaumii TaxID=56174 RepID=A0AAD5VFH6_9AGAR|nr:hypothetical protein NP233_g11980 [Leucocoprinus birnbaumii]
MLADFSQPTVTATKRKSPPTATDRDNTKQAHTKETGSAVASSNTSSSDLPSSTNIDLNMSSVTGNGNESPIGSPVTTKNEPPPTTHMVPTLTNTSAAISKNVATGMQVSPSATAPVQPVAPASASQASLASTANATAPTTTPMTLAAPMTNPTPMIMQPPAIPSVMTNTPGLPTATANPTMAAASNIAPQSHSFDNSTYSHSNILDINSAIQDLTLNTAIEEVKKDDNIWLGIAQLIENKKKILPVGFGKNGTTPEALCACDWKAKNPKGKVSEFVNYWAELPALGKWAWITKLREAPPSEVQAPVGGSSSSNKVKLARRLSNQLLRLITTFILLILSLFSYLCFATARKDLDCISHAFIEAANSRYRALIVAADAFPDSATEVPFVRAAAEHANNIVGPEEHRSLTPNLIRIIKQRGAQIRSEFKSRAQALVETCWDLSTSLSAEETEHNQDLVANLKFQSGFVYKTLGQDKKDLDSHSGLYQNCIIEKMIFQTVFCRRSDEGVVHVDLFKPIPAAALALTFTSIDCALDEWTSGSHIALEFTMKDYLEVYQGHLQDLQHFEKMTKKHNLFPRMCCCLLRAGRLHAGVGNSATVGYEQRIPSSAMLAAIKEHEAEAEATESDDSAPEDGVSGPLKRVLPATE